MLSSSCLSRCITFLNRESLFPSYYSKSLRYLTITLCLLLNLFVTSRGVAEDLIEVDVTGIDGQVYDNVMARLRINRLGLSGDFEERDVNRLHRLAPRDIESALAPYGFYSPVIDATLAVTENGWKAEYRIDPGRQVYITDLSVTIVGSEESMTALGEPEEIPSLRIGTPLNHPLYEKEKRNLLQRVRALGFLDASYHVSELRIDRRAYSAEIELVLYTGLRYQFGDIKSKQNVIYDDLLQHFIPFEKGDPFDRTLLQHLQRELYQTNYFGRVTVDAVIGNADDNQIPINVITDPREYYNRYNFGLGYATDTGANIRFDWQNQLLNKSGHRAFSSLLLGDQENHILFNYQVPGLNPKFETITGSMKWNRELWEDTDTEKFSAGAVYEYRTPVSYGAVSVVGFDEDYSIGSTSGRGKFLMPGLHRSLTRADDIINTQNGYRWSIDLEGASAAILSDASFLKVRFNGRAITTPITKWRLIGAASFGAILVDSIGDLPPSLRYYAGGEKSVRGYKYRTLGPEDNTGNIIGGKYLLAGSVTVEREVLENFRVSAFYDAGNAMNEWSLDLAHGIGVGAGVVLPFGQVKLELAYPLTEDGTAQYVFIRVGTDF